MKIYRLDKNSYSKSYVTNNSVIFLQPMNNKIKYITYTKRIIHTFRIRTMQKDQLNLKYKYF